MPWSGGNFTRANGNNGWATDQTNGIGIEAGRHDTQDNDFKDGINQCLNKDGSNAATGNLNLGGFKATSLANATAATDAMAFGQIRNGAPLYLDTANNRLGIGTTTPSVLVDALRTANDASTRIRLANQSNGSSAQTQIDLGNDQNLTYGGMFLNSSTNTANGGTNSLNIWNGGAIAVTTAGSERARFLTSGKVGFGTSSPTSFYEFSRVANDNATSLGVANTSNGSSASCTLNLGTDVSLSAAGLIMNSSTNGTNAGTNGLTFFNNAGGKIVVVASTNGVQLLNGGTSWGAISDIRKKKNIQPLNYGLREVSQINAIRFNYLTDEADTAERLGFSAQDLQTIVPEVVHENEDSFYSLTSTDLIPVLVNAIKELNAKVEALEAQVAEL